MSEKICAVCLTKFMGRSASDKYPNRGTVCSTKCSGVLRGMKSKISLATRASEKSAASIHCSHKSKLYGVWSAMKHRCDSPNSPEYRNYGGRGISVCNDWRDYLAFMDWALESGYSSGLSIERVDNEKGYSPDNCKWATKSEQARNMRTTKLDVKSVCEIRELLKAGVAGTVVAETYGVSSSLIYEIGNGYAWK